jgi:hypothetical protein
MLLGGMITAVQQEFERGAARRVEENEALRVLFRKAAPILKDNANLAGRLAEGAAGNDESFLISELDRTNARLRALLLELHAHVEEVDTPEARQIEEAIWAELVASTERRRLTIGRL